MPLDPIYFDGPAAFREWLMANHAMATEVQVGYHKQHTGRPTMSWPGSVDEALCFGWIDGIRRRVDEDRYTIRFTPRKARSIWSAINIARVAELTESGRMQPAGLLAFAARNEARSAIYSYEQRTLELDPALEARLRGDAVAWAFFESQPPGYRKLVKGWIMGAKQETTRLRRLATLIEDSTNGRRIRAVAISDRRD